MTTNRGFETAMIRACVDSINSLSYSSGTKRNWHRKTDVEVCLPVSPTPVYIIKSMRVRVLPSLSVSLGVVKL